MNELYEIIRTSIFETVTDPAERKQAIDAHRANTRMNAALAVVPKFKEWTHPHTGEVRKYIVNMFEVFGFNMATGEYAILEDSVSFRTASALKGWIRQSKPYVNGEGKICWGRKAFLPDELRHIGGALLVKIEKHAQELIDYRS